MQQDKFQTIAQKLFIETNGLCASLSFNNDGELEGQIDSDQVKFNDGSQIKMQNQTFEVWGEEQEPEELLEAGIAYKDQ